MADRTSTVARWMTALAVFSVVATGCSGSANPVVGVGDVGNGADVSVGVDVSSDGGMDAQVTTDVPVSADTSPGSDVQNTGDVPTATDTPTTDSGTHCATSMDCVGAAGGPVCDTTMGLCVACTTTQNMCMTGSYCTAMDTCAPGCTADTDCAATGATHCNTNTHMCTGCRAGVTSDCAPGTVCSSGACVPGCGPTSPCGIGSTCCGSTCVNTQTDSANCGACGTACSTGGACCAGACATLATDTHNCGTCGTSCTAANVATPTCTAGACTIPAGACASGYSDCDHMAANGCEANTATDPANCGACAHACPVGSNATASCAAGTCGLTCAGGYGDCNHMATDGCEATLAMDANNCGACGHMCPVLANATATCAMGTCGSTCAPGFGDCDGNPANGCETNLNTTGTACGSCTNVCNVANATASCTAGTCGVGTCNPGFANCDGLSSNGCETNATTTTNCGTCGTVCGVGTVCAAGTTGAYTCISVCSGGTTDCSGACVATQTDPTNCGACGMRCTTPPNGLPGCTAGVCGLASCDPGFGDCNHTLSDGCEVDLRTTLTSCGACGTVCSPYANATAACVGGACGIGSCTTGYGNCDSVTTNGCETNLNTTVADCGACGTVCSAPPNAAAACLSGACGIGACNTGFANCNGVTSDGCEVNVLTNNRNCGTCGHICAAGTACSAGTCNAICTAGTTFCAGTGTCANLTSDPANCGACGHACGAGNVCRASVCVPTPPSNDTCAGATPISLAAHAVDVPATTINAFHDLDTPAGCPAVGGPATSGKDVFFSFTLTQPELVYADTVGASWDTILFFANSCTTAIPLSASATGLVECDDDLNDIGCTRSTQSQVVAYLQPGTYYLVLSGWGSHTASASGTATIHFRHEPVGNDGAAVGAPPATPVLLPAGTSSQSGHTSGTGRITSDSLGLTACYTNGGGPAGTHGNGPENTYFWRTCPENPAGDFTATTCGLGTTFDTLIYVATPAVGSVAGDCDDDNAACGTAGFTPAGWTSILPHPTGGAVSVPAGADLHVFVIDAYAAGESGAYTVQVQRP